MVSGIFKIIATIFLTGSIYAIIGILIDKVLNFIGIARRMPIPIIGLAYVWAFLQIGIDEVSKATFVFFYILIVTFVIHRYDWWKTRQQGLWWWRSSENIE